MLTPNYMKKLPDDVVKYYRNLEDKILSDVVKDLQNNLELSGTSRGKLESLVNLNYDLNKIKKELNKDLDLTAYKLGQTVNKAGLKSYEMDKKAYEFGGKKLKNRSVLKMVDTMSKSSVEDLKNMSGTIGLGGKPLEKWYKETLNQGIIDITSGAYSRSNVMRKIVNDVGDKGLEFIEYQSGKNFSVEAAVKMNLVSTVNRLSAEISLSNAKEMDQDLMEITAHEGARPTHQDWQGQVVSLSGKEGYLTLDDIGFGDADGFMGVNCRHNWYPYFEGLSDKFWVDYKLDEINTFKYEEKTYTEEKAYQRLRNLERTARKHERKANLYNAVNDEEAKTIEKIKEQRVKQEHKKFEKVIKSNETCYNIVTPEGEEKLLKNSKKNWKDLMMSEQNAIVEYSGPHYGITNRYLRNALAPTDDIEWDQTLQRVKEIDRALSRNKLGDNLVLYRGVSQEEFEWWLKNDTLDAYKSSSISQVVAKQFNCKYQIVIKAPAKTQGFYLGDFSDFSSEKEFLINRNQKYKILKQENGILEVEIL